MRESKLEPMNNEAHKRSSNLAAIGRNLEMFLSCFVFSMPADHTAQEDVVVYFVNFVCYCQLMKVNSRCQKFQLAQFQDERKIYQQLSI